MSQTVQAWSGLFRNVTYLLLTLFLLSGAGWWLVHRGEPRSVVARPPAKTPLPSVDWTGVDLAVQAAMESAAKKAGAQGAVKLQEWTDGMMKRTDDDFLEWYFGYWNQQVLGLKGIWYWSVSQVMSGQPTAAEAITEEVQTEFAKRVLRPELAQKELEQIAQDVIRDYLTDVGSTISAIPQKYNVPAPEWDRYVEDLARMSTRFEGNRQVPLTLKLATGLTAKAGVDVAKTVGPAIKKIGGRMSGQMAGKAAGQMAAKTGAKVAAKGGGKMLGPIVGIGVMIWDVWDHYDTKSVEKPILRKQIEEYFQYVRHDLLEGPESGILSIIRMLEDEMVGTLKKRL